MLKQLLKTSRRVFILQKAYSLVNIFGLAIGIAVCLMIFRVVEFNASYDSFQPDAQHIYRFVTQVVRGDNTYPTPALPGPFPTAFRNDFPELKKVAPVLSLPNAEIQPLDNGGPAKSDRRVFNEELGVFFTGQEFFDIFYSKWLAGDKAVLSQPNTVILDRSHAIRYFGSWENATGRYIKLDNDITLKVAGIIEDYPVNSDFPLKALVSFSTLELHPRYYVAGLDNWGARTTDYQAFVSLPPNVTAAGVDQQLKHFVDKYFPKNGNAKWSAWLQPLQEMHFDDRFSIFPGHTTDKSTLWTLSVIGAFILLMALINFVNLATAQAIGRSKEIGVRKVLGSGRRRLIIQILVETSLIVWSALLLASLISLFAFPLLGRALDVPASVPLFVQSSFLFLLGCELLLTLLAGLYPALVLSGFDPLLALKNKINTSTLGGIPVRRGLVVLQFASLQMLIIGTIVVLIQMNFVRHADLGFNPDAIVEIPLRNDAGDTSRYNEINSLKNELGRLPSVLATTWCSAAPSTRGNSETGFLFESATDYADFSASYKSADPDYFNTFQLQFVAGKTYEDGDADKGLVINETMRKRLNLPDPQSAIGKTLRIGMMGGTDAPRVPIVGVVKDFKNHSLRDTVNPIVISHLNRMYQQMDIKIRAADLVSTIPKIRQLWQATFPNHVFDYTFLDENIARFYRQETQLASLYQLFTIIAILISCLGLFALVSFMALRRIKEMSIRKVLGASAGHIVYLFSKEFTLLIIVAFTIAGPCAALFMSHWLQHFAYRVPLNSSIFLLSMAGSLFIAWITIGYHAISVALANPAKILKTE
jgi:putative ABC transport system permease protein